MDLKRLTQELSQFLQADRFQDYCPNGLQVEGRPEVKCIISGVTASQALIAAAIEKNADAILVHHGYFWRGESAEICGTKKQRLKSLLVHDISLFAYHLPLDAHLEVGNNVQLARVLGWSVERYLDAKNMIAVTTLPEAMTLAQVQQHVSARLNRPADAIGAPDKPIKTVAWCTGAAQQYIAQAIEHDIDLFISGEVSEQTFHAVKESNTAYISAGHHATERYGVQALGNWLSERFDITHEYIELNNPI
jgi:dinuclear metal center YbgI/SA1388 family protein